MNRYTILLTPLFLAAVLVFLLITFSRVESAKNSWEDKVDPFLLELLQSRRPDHQIEFIVLLEEQTTISLPDGLDKNGQTMAVYKQLQKAAANSQQSLIETLKNEGAQVKPYVVINAVHVSAPLSILTTIAARDDVAFLHNNQPFQLDIQSARSSPFFTADAFQSTEWGIEKIGAPLLWADGITGTGAIIAGQDTGYNWNHPALINQYRGWDGDTADHNYNWHDAISSDINGDNNNPCGYSLTVPCDDIGSTHGTHTMGTMIGETNGYQIGVAPGAEWIACRNMEEGYGTPETYIDCFEWFLAPTDLNDENPDPSKAPHVINNSWGCPTSEGCSTFNFGVMDTVINNLRAAGIVVVTSAGNSGSSCNSVRTPAAIYEGSFAVGATNINDGITSFSSRGPVTVDGSGRIKPNVTAPGDAVRSATGTTGYGTLSGTSMAAPHVAGAVGLMISAYPPIAGNVEAIESYLEETADFLGIGSCGGDETFNNTYGHGRINVASAVDAILNLDVSKGNVAIQPSSETISYSITIKKTGPYLTFTNSLVSDSIPQGSFILSSSQPISMTENGFDWHIGDLGPNQETALEVTLGFGSNESLTQTLTFDPAVASAAHVPAQSSNQPVLFVPLFEVSRDIPQLPSDERIMLNGTTAEIEYTIHIRSPINTPSVDNVVVTETLPIGSTLLSTSESAQSTADGFVWSLGSMVADQTASIQVTLQIPLNPDGDLPEITFPATTVKGDNTFVVQSLPIELQNSKIWLPLVVK